MKHLSSFIRDIREAMNIIIKILVKNYKLRWTRLINSTRRDLLRISIRR